MSTARKEKLCELSSRWGKNKDALGFAYALTVNECRITYTFTDCPRKYRRNLTRLTDQLLKEAMGFVADAFSYPVRDDKEREEVQDFLGCRMSDYLNTLLESGYREFEHEVSSDAAVMQFASVAASLKREDGSWRNWKGDEFDPDSGCWVTKGGESVSDSASLALWGIMSGGKKRKFHAV